MYECPVCHYHGLMAKPYATWPPPADVDISPPYEAWLGKPSYEVCPSCGFEFGNDDNPGTAAPQSFESYRRDWQRAGCPTFNASLIKSRGERAAASGC